MARGRKNQGADTIAWHDKHRVQAQLHGGKKTKAQWHAMQRHDRSQEQLEHQAEHIARMNQSKSSATQT